MKAIYLFLCLNFIAFFAQGQGIAFFEGNYETALAKAKQEGKLLFVDFYATWCGPCKQMAQNEFPKKEVGDYFNKHFVAIQLDAEQSANREIVKRCKIKAYPTLAIFDGDGKILSIISGALDAAALLDMAKVATGEKLSFTEIYGKYRKSKGDLKLLQEVLMEAPSFVGTLEDDMEREKWIVRVTKLYQEYVKKKMGPDFINKEDYNIVLTFHENKGVPNDPIVEFINKHIDDYLKLGEGPAYFVMENNNQVIENLAHAGKIEYRKYLDRIKGDMGKAYTVADMGSKLPVYDRFRYLYDAEYELFYKKDADAYVNLMDEYFSAMDTTVINLEYGSAAQKVYQALGGNVSEQVRRKTIDWTLKALNGEMAIVERLNMLVLLGDIYRDMKNVEEARKCYNQAFMESLQVEQDMTKAMLQMHIQQRLGELELINN